MFKTFADFMPLEEGVNDPAIFKAIFLAGGPGAGKSFVVGNTALTAQGLKLINSDDAFERSLVKAGMEPTPENIGSESGQTMRNKAKALTSKKMDIALRGRLGLVIDGTGKNYTKIQKQKAALEALGYTTMLLFVNTNLETAQERNNRRARKLAAPLVAKMWQDVQNNIGKFQNLFGRNMLIVDNSADSNDAIMLSAYRKVSTWINSTSPNYIAARWIKAQHASRKTKVNEDLPPMAKLATLKRPQSSNQKALTKSREKKKVFKQIKTVGPAAGLEEELPLSEIYISIKDKVMAKTVHKRNYDAALKTLRDVITRKKKETGGKLRHDTDYYAHKVLKSFGAALNSKLLAQMYSESYDAQKHEWGTPEGTQYYKDMTPGQSVPRKKKGDQTVDNVVKEADDYSDLHQIEIHGFPDEDVLEMENDIDKMTFDDFISLGMYDDEELEDYDVEDEDVDIDGIQITEVLSIQGRMKRRFHAKRNKQKLAVARKRRSRMSSSPDRIKMKASRGARNMFKKRLARGRDVSAMPPAEKNRLELLIKRFAPVVSRLAQRMIPNVRKAEMGRLKNRKSGVSQKATKFKIKKGSSANKYKAKKFKIKAPAKAKKK